MKKKTRNNNFKSKCECLLKNNLLVHLAKDQMFVSVITITRLALHLSIKPLDQFKLHFTWQEMGLVIG